MFFRINKPFVAFFCINKPKIKNHFLWVRFPSGVPVFKPFLRLRVIIRVIILKNGNKKERANCSLFFFLSAFFKLMNTTFHSFALFFVVNVTEHFFHFSYHLFFAAFAGITSAVRIAAVIAVITSAPAVCCIS